MRKIKLLLFIGAISLAFSGVLFVSFDILNNLNQNYDEHSCLRLKLVTSLNALNEIERLDEQKQFCNNENCTSYFNEKIEGELEILNNTIEEKYCEKYGIGGEQ